FQDLVHIRRGASVQVGKTHAVAHEPPVFHKFCRVEYRREPVLYREVCNLFSVSNEDGAIHYEDCVSTPLGCGSEFSLNILGIWIMRHDNGNRDSCIFSGTGYWRTSRDDDVDLETH